MHVHIRKTTVRESHHERVTVVEEVVLVPDAPKPQRLSGGMVFLDGRPIGTIESLTMTGQFTR